jgi:hypothetical protein
LIEEEKREELMANRGNADGRGDRDRVLRFLSNTRADSMNWFGQKRGKRLSETTEIQSYFRREVDALLKEVGADFPLVPDGIINGKGYLEALNSLEPNTLEHLGFRSEHVRVLKSLALLLAQCGRVTATKQNLKIFEPLFHPAQPTTPTVADAYEEVVMMMEQSIGAK